MKQVVSFLCVAIVALLVLGAGETASRPRIQTPVAGPPVPWTSKALNNEADTFHFAIVSDLQHGERTGVFDDAVRKLNLLQPEFVMSIGDCIKGYTDNEKGLAAQWKSFGERVAKLEMRFFFVPGNHDIGGPSAQAARRVWAGTFGPSYYHFVYRDVLFLCLDTEDLRERVPAGRRDDQVDYVRKVLSEHAGARWTFVFMHRPLWIDAKAARWQQIERLLEARGHTVFAGHLHRYTKYTRHGQSYIILATTGGDPEPGFLKAGTFDHVAWVTVKSDGPVIANIMVDGVADENVCTEEMVKAALRGGK